MDKPYRQNTDKAAHWCGRVAGDVEAGALIATLAQIIREERASGDGVADEIIAAIAREFEADAPYIAARLRQEAERVSAR